MPPEKGLGRWHRLAGTVTWPARDAATSATDAPETGDGDGAAGAADAPLKDSGPASFMSAMSLPSLFGLYLLW